MNGVTERCAGRRDEILIIDDHPLVAEALGQLLRSQFPHLHQEIAGSEDAAVLLEDRDWFRVLVGMNASGTRGLSLVRVLRNNGLADRCCIFAAGEDRTLVAEARNLGVLGYIEKSRPVDALRRALCDVIYGIPTFPTEEPTAAPVASPLTQRQLALLRLLQQGLSSKQAARELNIAEGTVKNHTLALLRALNAANRAHAVARGIDLGLLGPGH